MGINFKEFKNDPKNRRIREVVTVGNKSVKVYEPTQDDVNKIIDMQESLMKILQGEEVEGAIDFSGMMVVKELFPLLTDIEGIESMTDDEIVEVVENPSIGLKRVSFEIEAILMETFSLVLAHARKDIIETDYATNQYLLTQDTINKTIKLTDKINGGNDELYQKISQSRDNLEKAIRAENEEELARIGLDNKEAFSKIKQISDRLKKEQPKESSDENLEEIKDVDEKLEEVSSNEKERDEMLESESTEDRMTAYAKELEEYRNNFSKGNAKSLG